LRGCYLSRAAGRCRGKKGQGGGTSRGIVRRWLCLLRRVRLSPCFLREVGFEREMGRENGPVTGSFEPTPAPRPVSTPEPVPAPLALEPAPSLIPVPNTPSLPTVPPILFSSARSSGSFATSASEAVPGREPTPLALGMKLDSSEGRLVVLALALAVCEPAMPSTSISKSEAET
jgi:hypothetical protein